MAADYSGVAWFAPLYNPGNPAQGAGVGALPPQTLRHLSIGPDNPIYIDNIQGKGPSPKLVAEGYIGDVNQWFMDQIWIFPAPVDYGNITSDKILSVNVLNTFRYTTRQVQDLAVAALAAVGVTQTAGPSVPVDIRFFQQLSFDFTASIDGPPAFDIDVQFGFDGAELIEVNFLGRRLILFTFAPDQPVPEQIGWLTDIFKAHDGNEQRQGLRSTPRQKIRYIFSRPEDAEIAKLRNVLRVFRGFAFGIPIWWEQRTTAQAESIGQTVLTVDTVGMDIRNDSTIQIYEPLTRAVQDATVLTFTATTITLAAGITSAMSNRAVIMPVRFGGITKNPQHADQKTGWLRSQVEFETEDNVEITYANLAALQVDWTTHPDDSIPIIDQCPVLPNSNVQTRNTRVSLTREDPKLGLPLQLQKHPTDDTLFTMQTFDIFTHTEILKWRKLLHWLRGSLNSFYLPTYRNDVPAAVDFNLDTTVITIENQGLDSLNALQGARRSLMLTVRSTGQVFYAAVTSVTEISSTQESMTLTNPFDSMDSTTIAFADARLSWLERRRIDGDVATFTHKHGGRATLAFNTVTIQQ